MKELGLKTENILFESSFDKQPVAATIYTSETVTPRAILQIAHGMAEHVSRYKRFAAFMAENGYVVCGNDHLGHGKTTGTDAHDGYFAPKNGREYVLKDLFQMNQLIRAKYPELPVILLGHSMGSFFARWFIEVYPDATAGTIICGTSGANPLGGIGIALTAMLTKIKGDTYVSSFVDNLAFGTYLKRIPQAKTRFDWLSVNEENVRAYVSDPKCGFPFTVSAFHEVMKLLAHVNSGKWMKAVPKALPLYFIAGREDPVGNYGVGPLEVATKLKKLGVQNISVKLYNQMRHEILNENEKEIVWNDVLSWCDLVLRVKSE